MLANGMRVVLLPLASVRTVDVRVVFPVGTAHEPPDQRGIAMLASHALEAHPSDDADMLRLYMAGAGVEVEVGFDHTAFVARGLDTHLDVFLTGLGHVVRAGVYGSLRETMDRFRLSQPASEDVLATLAWRRALYGDGHPYLAAGLWPHATARDRDQLVAFQRAHFLPDGAAVIISGGFDPALADRWVDYVFASWHGSPPPMHTRPARIRPFSFAQHEDTPQIAVQIALPTFGADRAATLVATEMVSQTIADVRQQLAASYGLSATLSEHRSSSVIVLRGHVDAQRATDALALVRERLSRLRDESEVTAGRFVAARRRVMNRLASITTRTSALAEWAQHDHELGRDVGSDRETARAVSALTLPKLAALLAKLDLVSAAMLLRGPADAVNKAYAALGRTPVLVKR